MAKTLVAYFSAGGVTKRTAEKLAEAAGADLFEIIPEVPYTAADLDWRDKSSRSTVEMQDKNSRPAFIKNELNPSEYDLIFLGYPVWWYTAPHIINSFLEAYDFSGKKIVLFATSGGSAFGKVTDDLKVSVPQSTQIIEGALLNGNPSVEALKKFVSEF